jgi:hypothetical protein
MCRRSIGEICQGCSAVGIHHADERLAQRRAVQCQRFLRACPLNRRTGRGIEAEDAVDIVSKPSCLMHGFTWAGGAYETTVARRRASLSGAHAFPPPATKFGLALGLACGGEIEPMRRYLSEAAAHSGAGYTSPYQPR